MKKLSAALAALGVMGAIGSPAASAAGSLACGDVVVIDTKLEASLTDCGAGLVIGASGVTVDLNGYAIEGTGRATASAGIEAAGVSGVTVKNGRIAGFDTGVLLQSVSGSNVEGVAISATNTGVRAFDPDTAPAVRNVIASNRISNSLNGITVFGSAVVAGNVVLDIAADGAPWSASSPIGIGIFCRSFGESSTVVTGNAVARAEHVGIELFFCPGEIVGNESVDNGLFGIHRERSNGALARNRANENGDTGIVSSDSHGVISRNVANANGGDGIVIFDEIAEHGPFYALAGNVANANTGFGIATSLIGVVDGGRNRAHANGERAQCLGISCNR